MDLATSIPGTLDDIEYGSCRRSALLIYAR
jgi:hypothetical protein